MSVLFVQQISIHHSRSDVDEKSLRAALKADYGYDGRRLSRFTLNALAAALPIGSVHHSPESGVYLGARFSSPAKFDNMLATLAEGGTPKPFDFTGNIHNAACFHTAQALGLLRPQPVYAGFRCARSHGRNRCLPPGSTCNKARLPLRWPAGAASRAACRRNKKAAAGCCFLCSNSPAASPASASGRLKAVMCFQTASTMMMHTKPPAGSPNACTPNNAPCSPPRWALRLK
jgi:hypothetical protein